jgi:phosphomannomutase
MNTPIVSVSGIRGIVGKSLDAAILTQFATAFGTLVNTARKRSLCDEGNNSNLPKTVVVGRDSRVSGEMVRHSILAGLISTGCRVIDVGLCPTPTILLMAKELNANGSIAITASHNPVEWNGLEFAFESGRLLNRQEREQFMEIHRSKDFHLAKWYQQGSVETFQGAIRRHIEKILDCDWVNLKLVRERALRVVIDCGNGAGSVASPHLLRQLGCEVIEVNCIPNGHFSRSAEPTPDALDQLCKAVQTNRADIGFAHDGDADRLVIVAEDGAPLGSEYTLALAADFILNRRHGDVVSTVSTSLMIDDIAARHHAQVHRTPVGVGFVVEKMRETNAIIGGEGTGGVVFPEIQYTTDGLASIAAIAHQLAESNTTISALVNSIPSYTMCQKKVESPSQSVSEAVVQRAAEIYAMEVQLAEEGRVSLDLTDGVKRVWRDSWVNIRKSGTEPVIRVFSEARTSDLAEVLCNETVETLKQIMAHES